MERDQADCIEVAISSKRLDVQTAIDAVGDPGHGAIDTFIGTVRNHHDGQRVKGITYDVYKVLAEKVLREICIEARAEWPGSRYYVSHYHGDLAVGGVSVVIAVSSAHRAASFEACRFVIEEIKRRAPVWKKEHYENGSSDWLPGHSLTDLESEGGINRECLTV